MWCSVTLFPQLQHCLSEERHWPQGWTPASLSRIMHSQIGQSPSQPRFPYRCHRLCNRSFRSCLRVCVVWLSHAAGTRRVTATTACCKSWEGPRQPQSGPTHIYPALSKSTQTPTSVCQSLTQGSAMRLRWVLSGRPIWCASRVSDGQRIWTKDAM